MQKTNIEWTATDGEPGFTANPLKYRDKSGAVVWGCVKTSPGCAHCYAETLANRYGRGGPFKQSVMDGLTPFLDEKELHKMLTYKPAAGKRCFVGDMTDVFGEWVPDQLLDRLFATFALRPDVTWQVLTKRAERLASYMQTPDRKRIIAEQTMYVSNLLAASAKSHTARIKLDHFSACFAGSGPFPNVWLGVSCEDQQRADERIPLLLQTPAAVRFLSVEPLLGPVQFPLPCKGSVFWSGIGWVIVGGESGHGSRECDVAWVDSIVAQCRAAGVSCFVKQLGSRPVSTEPLCPIDCQCGLHHGFRDRKGGDPAEWPKDLNVREFPVTLPH